MFAPRFIAAGLLVTIGAMGLPLDDSPLFIKGAEAQDVAQDGQAGTSGYVPLEAIFQAVRAISDGEIIDAELADRGGRSSYRITVLEKDGRVTRLFFDAATGARL